MKFRIGLIRIILFTGAVALFAECSRNKLDQKGFQVSPVDEENKQVDGITSDSLIIQTRPGSVLLTGIPRYRLTTVYKVNYNKDSSTFIGSNDYHGNYSEIGRAAGNQWNYNYMPGLEAVYGYNMINISHYDIETQARRDFFKRPVLIKTLYYPSFSKDTLNYQPLNRNYFLVSAYDEDTNKDGFINVMDLRRFYHFDIDGKNKTALIPMSYSVTKSEYDPSNDFMFVFARLDENANGRSDEGEADHIFWVDLKDPDRTGRQY